MGWAVLVSALQALLKKAPLTPLSGMQIVTLHLMASSMLIAMLRNHCNKLEAYEERKSKLERRYDTGG